MPVADMAHQPGVTQPAQLATCLIAWLALFPAG